MFTDNVRSHRVGSVFDRIDQQVLSQRLHGHVDESETPRDRLFGISDDAGLMRYKNGVRSGYVCNSASICGRCVDPRLLLLRAPAVVHSMALMLIASGMEASSPLGVARAHALAAAYALVIRTWLKDDSADMAKTMSALDKNLSRLKKVQSMVLARKPARSSASEDGAEES